MKRFFALRKWCQSCGGDAAVKWRSFDADADGLRCKRIRLCQHCDQWYRERENRVGLANRARKQRRQAAQRAAALAAHESPAAYAGAGG